MATKLDEAWLQIEKAVDDVEGQIGDYVERRHVLAVAILAYAQAAVEEADTLGLLEALAKRYKRCEIRLEYGWFSAISDGKRFRYERIATGAAPVMHLSRDEAAALLGEP